MKKIFFALTLIFVLISGCTQQPESTEEAADKITDSKEAPGSELINGAAGTVQPSAPPKKIEIFNEEQGSAGELFDETVEQTGDIFGEEAAKQGSVFGSE